jgi:macrolide transport system ATP-binding/permease protein
VGKTDRRDRPHPRNLVGEFAMPLIRNLFGGLMGLFQRKEMEQQLDEELAAYLEIAVEKKIESGLSRSEALRAARAEMGSMTAVKEQVHRAGWESAVGDFGRDLRFGARMLRSNPGVTLVAVLTLALGIGMNAGIFTILNGAALRLLPVPHAQNLFMVSQDFSKSHGPVSRNVHNDGSFFSYSEYREYREHNQVFTGLLAYLPFASVTASLGGAHPQQLLGTLVSCNYFAVLEVPPQVGPGFRDSDCAAEGAGPVVVLSDELWRASFAADPAIVGKSVHLNRTSFVVAGIAPAGFNGTEPVKSQFWAPLTMQRALVRDRDYLHDDKLSWLGLIGRIKPEVSPAQARADLAVIASRIDQLQPGRVTTIELGTATLLAAHEERSLFLGAGAVLLLAVGLVLLIACANVANLLLARATARRKEIAVKRALGATRWRLIRQLLTESLLLAISGGALGWVVAVWFSASLLRFVLSNVPAGTPQFALNPSPDLRVLAYTLVLTLVTAIAFGLAPALNATHTDLTLAMKEEGAETHVGSGRGGWLRSSLVATQIAVCMVLLLAAGLFLRGWQRTYTMDPGFSMKNTAVVSFDLIGAGYNEQRAIAFQQALAERVSAIPGVDRVSQVARSPLSDDHWVFNYSVVGRKDDFDAEYNNVSPEYFPLLGIPIVRGRNFTDAENRAGSPVVILTESTARRVWPGEDPIGKALREGRGGTDPGLQVVGIAKDAQVAFPGDATTLYLYRPAGPKEQTRMLLMVHSAGTYAAISKTIKMAGQTLDPELVVQVARLEDNMDLWRSFSRIISTLSTMLGGLALLLASIGVYGMVSYAVSRRIREIGIRMALGAGVGNIMSLIVRQGMLPVVVGAGIGMACCAAVSSFMSSVLYGVSPWDPISFIFVPAFLFAVALAACWIPARKAARVDPVESLRCG